MKIKYLLIIGFFFLHGCSVYTQSDNDEVKEQSYVYSCDDEQALEIVYIKPERIKLTVQDQEKNSVYFLSRVRAASGLKYESTNLVWWSKNNKGYYTDGQRELSCVLK